MDKQNFSPTPTLIPHAVHPWLLVKKVTYVPGKTTPLLDEFAEGLLRAFRQHGHPTPSTPEKDTDILFTTAPFGEPLNWRECLSVVARRKFDLDRSPTIYTLVQATPEQFQQLLDHFTLALQKPAPDPQDFNYPGLSSQAYETLYEQGHRGGPILSIVRLLQSQAMCIRYILVMNIIVTGRHLEVTPALQKYAEEKIKKFSRYLSNISEAIITLSVEKYRHKVEVLLKVNGVLIQAEGITGEIYSSIDEVVEKLERQVKRYKENTRFPQ